MKEGCSSCNVGSSRAGKKFFKKLTSDRETTETPLRLEILGLSDGGLGRENDRVQDEAVLISLDLADHLSLVLRSAVVVDNTQTTEESHVDGHVMLGDGVHGGRQKGGLQGDALGNWSVQADVGGREAY